MKTIKKKNTFNNKRLFGIITIILCIVFFGIGYAYLNEDLNLNGTAGIAKTSWNIYFDNIVFKDGNVTATSPAVIDKDKGTTINMTLELGKPGDYYSFDVDIVNDGTIDAMLTEIFKTNLTEEELEYLDFTVKYKDGNDIKIKDALRKKSRETITVSISLVDDLSKIPNDASLDLRLTLNYVQDDGTGNGTRITYDIGIFELGTNNWYKSLNLDFKILEDEKITTTKYCITSETSCVPNKEIQNNNGVYSIELPSNAAYQVVCLTATDSDSKEYSRCSNKYKVDKDKPTINSVSAVPDDDTITVTINADDLHSGISKYYYSKDSGNTYIESLNPNYTFTSLEEGDYLITAYIEDNAGNISQASAASTTVRHKSYCEKNNITNLADCIIATEQKNTNIEEAKQSVIDKGTPDFTKISPATKFSEVHGTTLSNDTRTTYSNIATEYTFNPDTGIYTLKAGTYTYTDPTSIDYTTGNYYTCISTNTTCSTLYKISSATKTVNETTGVETFTIKKYNYTSEVLSYDNSEIGLYAANDDDGTSYYYRGAVGGNYVKFAGYYWRVIRVNGDNSVRLIYDGKNPHKNGEASYDRQVGTSAFNTWWSDNAYVGYMYGDTSNNVISEYSYAFTYIGLSKTAKYYYSDNYTFDKATNTFKLAGNIISMTIPEYRDNHNNDKLYTCFSTSATESCQRINRVQKYVSDTSMSVKAVEYGSPSLESATANIKDSTIKTYLDKWYTNNLISYTNKLSNNSSFCNDREISSRKSGAYQNAGYGATPTIYGYTRFYDWQGTATGPRLTCPNINDRFTITTSSVGNKKLAKPIGLITADEVNMAGGRTGNNNLLYYLYSGTTYWTASPSYFYYWSNASIFRVSYLGDLFGWHNVANSYGVRPVINLDSSNLVFSGSGTMEDPYVIE